MSLKLTVKAVVGKQIILSTFGLVPLFLADAALNLVFSPSLHHLLFFSLNPAAIYMSCLAPEGSVDGDIYICGLCRGRQARTHALDFNYARRSSAVMDL